MELKSFQEEAVSLVQVSTLHNVQQLALTGTTIPQGLSVKPVPQNMELTVFSALRPSALLAHTLQTLSFLMTLSVVSMFLQAATFQTAHHAQL